MKEQIIKLEIEIEQLKSDNKEKDEAIIELSQFYYVRNNNFIKYFIIQYYKNKSQNGSIDEDKNEEDEN